MATVYILLTMKTEFIEGRDYTLEKGMVILTEYYLTKRGSCCSSGCKNCPYTQPPTKGNTNLKPHLKK